MKVFHGGNKVRDGHKEERQRGVGEEEVGGAH